MAEEGKHSPSRSSRHTSSGRSSSRREKEDDEAKPDDGISRSERRRKEDREAKNRARSGRSSQASTPGAVASTEEHKSSRKSSSSTRHSSRSPNRSSSRRSGDEKAGYRRSSSATTPGAHSEIDSSNRSSRSRRSDEKAGYRRSGSATTPGAQSEVSSPRPSKRDEKAKERRGTRASRPGAEAATSSSDKASRKKSGSGGVPASPLGASARSTVSANTGGEGEHVVAAMIVEEEKEDEDTKREREQARIQEMVAAETEKARQQMEAEQKRQQEERERQEAEKKDRKRKAKDRRNKIICVLILLALIGGGVGAYFALTNKKAATPQEEQETQGPSADPSTSPSFDPTLKPSTAPSVVELKYPEPTLEECELIAKGLKIPGEDEMFVKNFAIPMEVTLEPGNDIDSLMADLEIAIEKYLVPDLIGCPRYLFQLRRLFGYPDSNTSVSMWSNRRELQNLVGIRWVIAKAVVDGTVNTGACEYSSSPDCTVVTTNMVLRVRGEEKLFLIAGVIGLIFPFGKDIQPDLLLGTPFESVVVSAIKALDETAPPTIAPTVTASENPSGFPSSNPSTSPSSGPGNGGGSGSGPTKSPTSGGPGTGPTGTTAPAPTRPPTKAPTSTPPPTFAPQPGLTPPPTPPPTKSPTITPTMTPTSSPTTPLPTYAPVVGPSPPPTTAPTKSPSTMPSVAPSKDLSPTSAPTDAPSFRPSRNPTPRPSRVPSPEPTTKRPTKSPTKSPTSGPTSSPTGDYLGCWADDWDRVMEVRAKDSDVQGCRSLCESLGFPYAALQDGYQCFCGNQYNTLGPSNNCNVACVNNPSQDVYCGGGFANSVYLSGAPVGSSVPDLAGGLDCGCYADNYPNGRDLPTVATESHLSQKACIHYCKAQGYNFAGLQIAGEQCFCGNDAGSYGMSLQCSTRDTDPRDGNQDFCRIGGAKACYDNMWECLCGGANANTLFRTSASVSCPVRQPHTQSYLGCHVEHASGAELNVIAKMSSSVAECKNICKDMDFTYSAITYGQRCYCTNTYATGWTESTNNCNMACVVNPSESGCGSSTRFSVYYSGARLQVNPDLENNLYCGCKADQFDPARDLSLWVSAYMDLSPQACIHYCRKNNYNFAGLQFGSECWCGNTAGTYGSSANCNMACSNQGAKKCYGDTSSCTCGGSLAIDLYRTSTSVSCP